MRAAPLIIAGKTRDAISARSIFIRAKKIELRYSSRLRSVAQVIQHYVKGIVPASGLSAGDAETLQQALRQYASTLTPWARSVAERMLAEVSARDDRAWQSAAQTMSRHLRREIEQAPTGQLMQARLDEQISLITSLPREAAERVRKLATEAKASGTRADVLAAKILETGEVTKARANTIARTETSRTATELTRARAMHVGSVGYVWRTAGDADVRKSHKALNGTFHAWDDPPECDPGKKAHPGCIFNCRCWCEVVLPGDEDEHPVRFRTMN